MNLNHINLCASDVPATTEVLQTHLGYRVLEAGKVPNYPGVTNAGSDFSMLLGEDGSYIVITQIPTPEPGQSAYPHAFHFGLMQPTESAVHAKHQELTAAGFTPDDISSFAVLGATWTAFYCPIGDGLQVEINHRTHSDILDGTH